MVYTEDLKSSAVMACRFESGPGPHIKIHCRLRLQAGVGWHIVC